MGARHTKRPSGQDATATDAVVPGAVAVRPRAGRLSSRSRLSDTGDKSGACSRRAARTSGGSAGTASLARVPPAGQRTGRAWSRRRPGFPCKGAPVIDVLGVGPRRSPGIVDFRPFVRPRLHDLPTMGNTPGVRESYTNRSHRHVAIVQSSPPAPRERWTMPDCFSAPGADAKCSSARAGIGPSSTVAAVAFPELAHAPPLARRADSLVGGECKSPAPPRVPKALRVLPSIK